MHALPTGNRTLRLSIVHLIASGALYLPVSKLHCRLESIIIRLRIDNRQWCLSGPLQLEAKSKGQLLPVHIAFWGAFAVAMQRLLVVCWIIVADSSMVLPLQEAIYQLLRLAGLLEALPLPARSAQADLVAASISQKATLAEREVKCTPSS